MLKKQGKFSCSICSSSFRNGDALHKHFKLSRCSLGSLKRLTNNKCQSKQNDIHEEAEARINKYECGYCSKVFPDCSNLELHLSKECRGVSNAADSSVRASKDNVEINQSSEFECGYCRTKCRLLTELILHIKLNHNTGDDNEDDDDIFKDKLDYVCGRCNLKFSCSKEMISHMQVCYVDTDSAFTHRPQTEFENDCNRQSHVPKNHKKSEYHCGQCGNTFESTKTLVQHIAAVHSIPDSCTEKLPVKEFVIGHETDNVTIPTSLLLRFISHIQCDHCYNFSKLNVNDKCTCCNQLISVKLNQVICLCMHIPFKSLKSLSYHLCKCTDIKEVTNQKNLVLKYSKKDKKRMFCVNDQLNCPEVGSDYLNKSMKMQIDFDNLTKLKEKESYKSHEMEYCTEHGGRRKEEEDVHKFRKQRSVIIEDYVSVSSDTDASSFEEIFIDRATATKFRTPSDRDNEEDYSSSDTDIDETMLQNQIEYEPDFVKYNITPCKVVLERISQQKIEFYSGKRKRLTSSIEFEPSRCKQACTNKIDEKAGEQRTEEVEECTTFSRKNVSAKRSVARKRSNKRKCKFKGSYSQDQGKVTQSKLVNRSRNEKSVQRNSPNKIIKSSRLRVNEVPDFFEKEKKDSKNRRDYSTERHESCEVEEGDEVLTCEICTSTFSSTSELEIHSLEHLPPPVFKCSECDLVFSTKDSLDEHANSHALEDEFVCGICQLKFSVQEQLENHMIKHFANPIVYQQLPESSTIGDADNNAKSHSTKSLPKLLAYKPKINL